MSNLKVVISAKRGWVRAALMDDDALMDMAVDRPKGLDDFAVGSIYVGRVRSVSKPLDAAFVDIGAAREGFLGQSDTLANTLGAGLKEGDAVCVQVQSPAVEGKGVKLSMRVSIPGRTVVLTPFSDAITVSKNLKGKSQEKALKQVASDAVPNGCGCIIRSVARNGAVDILAAEIAKLHGDWMPVAESLNAGPVPRLLRGPDVVSIRLLSDLPQMPVSVTVDDGALRTALVTWANAVWPGLADRIDHWNRAEDVFESMGVNAATDDVTAMSHDLPSGGRLTIERTQGLIAVDVDVASADSRGGHQQTKLVVNKEAATALSRLLRSRNLAGLIVVDFLKMPNRKDRDTVLQQLKDASKNDPAGVRVGGFTPFGLVELTRSRRGAVLDDVLGEFVAETAA